MWKWEPDPPPPTKTVMLNGVKTKCRFVYDGRTLYLSGNTKFPQPLAGERYHFCKVAGVKIDMEQNGDWECYSGGRGNDSYSWGLRSVDSVKLPKRALARS